MAVGQRVALSAVSLGEIDAVTLDAHGTLVELEDPVPPLVAALAAPEMDVQRGLDAEFAYYGEHVLDGHDNPSLADLRRRCTAVFLEAAGIRRDPASFVDEFQRALRFVPIAGALETVRRLRAHGLALAVVSNWDVGLHEHLRRLGFAQHVDLIVTSAEIGVRKPDPRLFVHALERLGIPPHRALHVGDRDELDGEGALATGMRFASAPLADLLP